MYITAADIKCVLRNIILCTVKSLNRISSFQYYNEQTKKFTRTMTGQRHVEELKLL